MELRFPGVLCAIILGVLLIAMPPWPALHLTVISQAQTLDTLATDDGAFKAPIQPLWWFDGENPQNPNYPTTIGLVYVPTPPHVLPPGFQITWYILDGAENAYWRDCGSPTCAIYTAPPNVTSVALTSRGASKKRSNVKIVAVSSDGYKTSEGFVTVLAPAYVKNFITQHSGTFDPSLDYYSQEGFRAYDTLDRPLVHPIEWNEKKGPIVTDWRKSVNGVMKEANWKFKGDNPIITYPDEMADSMSPPPRGTVYDDTGPMYPTAQRPAKRKGKYAGDPISHRPIHLNMGSLVIGKGITVWGATQQYYRDHAQHNR